MNVKRSLFLWVAVCALAMPLLFVTGIASAAVYNSDGAVHDGSTGAWQAPASYCVAPPQDPATGLEWDGISYNSVPGAVPNAVKRTLSGLQCQATPTGVIPAAAVTAVKNQFTGNASGCQTAGYRWKTSSGGSCSATGWTMDDPTQAGNAINWYTLGNNACLRCHNSTYMTTANGHNPDANKESYILGGHKNMSRMADGKKWGMPGVTDSSLANPGLAEAGLLSDGSFSFLWIQEDYPTMVVNWINNTVNTGYCGTALGVTGTGDTPDLAACAAYGQNCESPIMGNGAAGYPLGYKTQALCENARKPSTGATGYVWTPNADLPLYWIYGGAGLEGGPAMMEPGTQQYKCGRCHTTGWTANTATDTVITGKTKLPYSNPAWSSVDFTTLKAVGSSSSLLLGPAITGYALSSWDQFGIECSRCHKATDGGHATWPSVGAAGQAGKTTGGDIVAMCVTCHRQEGDPEPRAVSGGNGFAANYNAATPFTNKAQQPDGFAHHPDGPEFLNSPHSMFTGTWGQIGCPPSAMSGYGDTATRAGNPLLAITTCSTGTMNTDGSTSSLFASRFAQAVVTDLGDNTSTAGGCTSCHDAHQPLNNNVAGMSKSVKVECTGCHSNPAATISPQVDLSVIAHKGGMYTPLANVATDPMSACVICHQPAGIKHLWRINTDANYTMYGDYGITATGGSASSVNLSNTASDGAYTNAVWIDLDNACGQCHGGGVSATDISTTTTATFSGSVSSISVASTFGFESGKKVRITGGGTAGADFETIIAKVVRTNPTSTTDLSGTVYLTYNTPASAPTVSAGEPVAVGGNPPYNAPYLTRAFLAVNAKGIHTRKLTPSPNFTWANINSTNNAFKFNGAYTLCPSGVTCIYDWDFGDGLGTMSTGTISTVNYMYSSNTASTYDVTLTVSAQGYTGASSSITKTVTVMAPHTAPVVVTNATFTSVATDPTFTYIVPDASNPWQVSITDASTISTATGTIIISWGDGTVTKQATTDPNRSFSHVYKRASTYRIMHSVLDSGKGVYPTRPMTATKTYKSIVPTKYVISGIVTNSAGAGLSYARVTLKLNGHTVANRVTNLDGTYTITNVLPTKPTDTGYTVSGYKYSGTILSNGSHLYSFPTTTIPTLNSDQTVNLQSSNQ